MIDALRYLLVCTLFVSAGLGVIRLLRVQLTPNVSLLLGACVTQALLAICFGSSVVAGIPLGRIAIPLWVALLALAAYGVRSWRADATSTRLDPRNSASAHETERRQAIVLLAVSAAAAPLVMVPYFVYGLAEYPGSGLLDGWSYAAFGQYLWEFPRDTEGGLAPLYQYAVHLGHTRFAAPGQLGFLSILGSLGDTQSASGLLRAVSIFTMASACAAFAQVRRLALPIGCLYVCLAAISGWTFAVVWANNYDHGLALQYSPALATLATCLPMWTLTTAILTGIVAAGALYTYPEFALLALTMAGVLAIEAVVARKTYRTWSRALFVLLTATVLVLLTATVLVAPYWGDFRGFILNQLTSGLQTGPRPGAGMFPGLLDPRYRLSALVALGGERLSPNFPLLSTLVAASVMAAFVVGVLRLLWRREAGLPLIIGGLCAIAGLLIWHQQYDYGAYKVLSLGWWAFAFAAISGVTWLPDALVDARRLAWAIAGLLALAVPAVTGARAISETVYASGERMSQYRAIEKLPELIDHAPLMLNASDVAAEHWGTYFLRRADMLLGLRNGYLAMPHLTNLLDRARPVPATRVRYVVTDAAIYSRERPAGWRLAWGVGRFAVWDTSTQGWAAVTRIRDALGNDAWPRPYFYAGPPGATLQVLASRDGTLVLSTRLFNLFSTTDRSCWRLRLTKTSTAAPPEDITLRPGAVTMGVPVSAGASTITLLASPTTPTARSATPEASREGGLADTNAELLPVGASNANRSEGQPASYTTCDASS